MRAQELLDRGDKEDGMRITKTQNMKLVAQGMNIEHRNTREPVSVECKTWRTQEKGTNVTKVHRL